MLSYMATARRSPYEKFFARYASTSAEILIAPRPSEALQKRWQDVNYRYQHWLEHEQEPDGCEWCKRYPALLQ